MELCANSKATFVKSREDWIVVLMIANFEETDEAKDILVKGLLKQKYYDALQSLERVELVEGSA